jgi:hypothetical protein
MAERSLRVDQDQPLIAIPMEDQGREVVCYFADDEAADEATTSGSIQETLALGGAWNDLDWEEMEAALQRMRHEVLPTPPLDEL